MHRGKRLRFHFLHIRSARQQYARGSVIPVFGVDKAIFFLALPVRTGSTNEPPKHNESASVADGCSITKLDFMPLVTFR